MSNSDANAKVIDGATIAPANVAAILRSAALLVEPEGRWTKDALARDDAGREIRYGGDLERAVCFCANGAIWAAGGTGAFVDATNAFERYLGTYTTIWNDALKRTQAEVVTALRGAADLAERAATPAAQTADDGPGSASQ